jgi:Ricin-type beta-trefoil lectin domain
MSDRQTGPGRAGAARIRHASVLPRVSTPPVPGTFAPGVIRSPGPSGDRPGPKPSITALATPPPESRLVPLKVAVALLVAAPFAVTLVTSRAIFARHAPGGGRPIAQRPSAPASSPARRPSPTPKPTPTPTPTPSVRSASPRPSSTGAMNVHLPAKPKKSRKPSTAPAEPPVVRAAAGPPTRMLMSEASGRCIDVTGGEPDDGTPLQIRDCTGGAREHWTFERDGTVRSMGLCMDAAWGSSDDGTVVQLVRCHGGPAQHFALNGYGELLNLGSGKCVDVVDMETRNGTRLQLWECAGTSNQRWSAV